MRWFIALLTLAATLRAGPKPLWLACGPAGLLTAIEPLAEHRRAEGMEVLTLPLGPLDALARSPRRPDFFLIVGDDEKAGVAEAPWLAASARRPYHHWQDPRKTQFASDFALAGLDRDGVPLVPTGRIAARSPAEAAQIAAKIIAFEKLPPPPLGLPIWAGDPRYAPEYTERFMAFLFGQVQRSAPPWVEPWVLSGDTKHVLAGPFAAQARTWNERTGQGAMFTGMIGHGNWNLFESYRAGGKPRGYFLDDAKVLADGPPRPPHVIIACNCAEFVRPGAPCLAEELVLAPGGPVLCIAATEESHPLPNFYTATSLLRRLQSADGPVRFGRLFLDAQRDARRRSDLLYELLLRDAEGRLNKARSDIETLKTDHAAIYAIIGDPATRVLLPRALKVTTARNADGWSWHAEAPPGARRLVVERRIHAVDFPPRPANADDSTTAALFVKANEALAFRPLATVEAGAEWRGHIAEPGIVRFVAETEGGTHVFGVELRVP
jgi:Peptidase family C25